jgi:hypothetical protein
MMTVRYCEVGTTVTLCNAQSCRHRFSLLNMHILLALLLATCTVTTWQLREYFSLMIMTGETL